MNQSESIAKLAEALSKAQGAMESAKKTSSNPFYKSTYSDLASVWDACRRPLADNGLSVVQTSEFIPEHPEIVCIDTVLLHSSGEWMRGRLAVKPTKPDPQSVGSCITYLRRYSLQAMVGIALEDDDGNAASGNTGRGDLNDRNKKEATRLLKESKKASIQGTKLVPETSQDDIQEFPVPEGSPEPGGRTKGHPAPSEGEIKLATREQVTKIQIMMKERGRTDRQAILDDLAGFCERTIHSSKELSMVEASAWIDANTAG